MAHFTQGIHKAPTVEVDNMIVAPEHMVAITGTGSIHNLTQEMNGVSVYIYFSNEDCADGRFLVKLKKVMGEQGAYEDNVFYPDGVYYEVNNSVIFFFDTKKMPSEEVNYVLSLLDIDMTPCLVRVENRVVADRITTTDDTEVDEARIKEFFQFARKEAVMGAVGLSLYSAIWFFRSNQPAG
jgi:hypothetical protein